MSIRAVQQTTKATAAFFKATPEAAKLSPKQLEDEICTWWKHAGAAQFPLVVMPKLRHSILAALATNEWRAGASGQGPIESMLFN